MRAGLTALARVLAAGLALWGPSALAQSRNADAELEALIPDAALDAPDDWAKAAEPASPAPDAPEIPAEPALDPSSPLVELPAPALPWPDGADELPAFADLPPEPGVEQVAEPALPDLPVATPQPPALADEDDGEGTASRISPRLTLVFPADPAAFPQREAFEQRFRLLSTLETMAGGEGDTIAQLSVRARVDRDMIQRLLRIYGYYDADVTQTVGGAEGGRDAKASGIAIRFDIQPGARYRLGRIDLGDLASTGADFPALSASTGLVGGDPLNSDAIVLGRTRLDESLGERGFVFARIAEPDLLIDHRRAEGDLAMPVAPGGRYRIAGVASGLPDFLSSSHLQTIARFDPGDLYRRSEVDDLRRAVLATGLVSAVNVSPREVKPPAGAEPGEVMLDVSLAQAPLRTMAGAAGYDSGDGFRLEASWEHRNLFPPEGMLRLRGILGTKEQLAGVTFRRNNFRGRDQVLTVDLYGNVVNRTAYAARTVALAGSFAKLTTLIFQKPWTWSVGAEVLATNEREGTVNGTDSARTTYVIAALPLRAAFDGSDDLLDPTRGLRASLRVSPEVSLDGGRRFAYARIQADASFYQPLGGGVVLAARARIGSIAGTGLVNIAPSRRFYAGGGGSVRGFGYQLIGPRDTLGDPSGGRSLNEFSLEARVRTGLFGGALSVVPFLDAGGVDEGSVPRLRDMRYGAGIGVRYETSFGPVRVDIGTPLNRREGESRIGVYVALGQAF